MKVEDILLAKCINDIDPMGDSKIDLEVGKYYKVTFISMGQSYTSITIGDKSYNSILFEFYNLTEVDIYSKYSPYRSNKDESK